MKTVLLIFFLLSSLIVFSQSTVPVYRVSPFQTKGGNISTFFSDFEYVPLETKPESLFGDIQKLIVTDSSFIIRDRDTKSILFFNHQGKFLKRIKSSGGAQPYFKYDEKNKVVKITYIKDSDIDKEPLTVHFYNFSTGGNVIDTTNEPIATEIQRVKINLSPDYSFTPISCTYKMETGPKDTTIYLINILKGDSLFKRLIPYNQKEKMAFCYFARKMWENPDNYTVIDGQTYAATPVENYVYKLTKDSAVKICEIVFPKNASISKEILKLRDVRSIDSALKVPTPAGTIYGISNIFFKGPKLFFKGVANGYLSNISASSPQVYNFIYDTISHKAVAIERLTSDAATFYLPAFDPRDGLMIKGLIYSRDNFYSYVSSLDMFNARNATKHRNPQYPPALQQYFKTQNRKSNPVIVRMKLKEGE
ncbi:MAG TPA: 6-bladed beta-propeller [Niabella sp.]|nr:6-bladed beta-propeller [Niabella sp.]HQX21092.1 6-bladed beta-propeller [Niabella sp.]HRC22318.1 6-bladed beta-propeller [Niabella sp.]HRC31748.1 6-bladed beta-propeller [Niabella sp.]